MMLHTQPRRLSATGRRIPLVAHRKTRSIFLTMAIIVGLVAVAVPAACITGACDLSSDQSPGGAVPHDAMSHDGMPHAVAPVFQAVCDMATMAVGAVEEGIPPSTPTPLVGLFAALALAIVSLMPRLTLLRVQAQVGDPPGPPGDLRGVRLLI